MNPKTHDFIPIKWLHKELVERRLKSEETEWVVTDKAIEIFNEIVAKWRKENG